ncbi:MAG: hypothetical protein M1142_06445 [Patescibacteria group bacterium]|nr:hypothetical protein [Patescibacteria group bacterium]
MEKRNPLAIWNLRKAQTSLGTQGSLQLADKSSTAVMKASTALSNERSRGVDQLQEFKVVETCVRISSVAKVGCSDRACAEKALEKVWPTKIRLDSIIQSLAQSCNYPIEVISRTERFKAPIEQRGKMEVTPNNEIRAWRIEEESDFHDLIKQFEEAIGAKLTLGEVSQSVATDESGLIVSNKQLGSYGRYPSQKIELIRIVGETFESLPQTPDVAQVTSLQPSTELPPVSPTSNTPSSTFNGDFNWASKGLASSEEY